VKTAATYGRGTQLRVRIVHQKAMEPYRGREGREPTVFKERRPCSKEAGKPLGEAMGEKGPSPVRTKATQKKQKLPQLADKEKEGGGGGGK